MYSLSRFSLLAVAIVAFHASPAKAQVAGSAPDKEKEAAIRRLLEVTNVADGVILTMEAALPAQRAVNTAVPDVFWDRFIKRARQTRGEFIDAVVPIYDRQFTLSEINQLIDFYSTPVGKRFVAALPQITKEAMAEGQAWGQRLGLQVGEELRREGVLK